MTRLSKTLCVAAAMLAAPVTTAFADDDEATAGGESGEGGGGADGGGAASATPAAADVSATVSGTLGPSIIDRQLVLEKSMLAFQADAGFASTQDRVGNVTSDAETTIAMQVGAGYGVTDKITVGGTYAFQLSDFEIKGPLTVYGDYNITDNGKLSVAASADVAANFNGTDELGDSSVDLAIHAGIAVRYKIIPKLAVYTGNPYTPGPSGQQLNIGITEGEDKTFEVPVGVAFQAMPALYTYFDANLATISLSDPGMDASRLVTVDDTVPFRIGGWFNVTKGLDAGAAFNSDFHRIGDDYGVTVGARYYK
ncbi:MAG: hypothetical protein SFX73_04535 [Kofleriaceae bacterium]|nr:hypothetical protein [Kofleriaceae bacterium]